jgi:transcriptional regulator with XRE-family HTH domain
VSTTSGEADAARADDLRARIRTARRARGWSIEQLAQTAGTSPRTITRIESGADYGGAGSIPKVAAALGIDVDNPGGTGTYTIDEALDLASDAQLLAKVAHRMARARERAEGLPTASYHIPLSEAPSQRAERHDDTGNA